MWKLRDARRTFPRSLRAARSGRYHPDKNKAPDAAERFQRISTAKDVLSDAAQRRSYDHTLRMEGRFH